MERVLVVGDGALGEADGMPSEGDRHECATEVEDQVERPEAKRQADLTAPGPNDPLRELRW